MIDSYTVEGSRWGDLCEGLRLAGSFGLIKTTRTHVWSGGPPTGDCFRVIVSG